MFAEPFRTGSPHYCGGTMLGYSTRHATTKISKRTGALPIPASSRNAPHTRSNGTHTAFTQAIKQTCPTCCVGLRYVAMRRGERDESAPGLIGTPLKSPKKREFLHLTVRNELSRASHHNTTSAKKETEQRFLSWYEIAPHSPLQTASAHAANFTVRL